jgi:hypothetical protein
LFLLKDPARRRSSQGGHDDGDDDEHLTGAASLQFANGAWNAALRSVAVDELLFSPSLLTVLVSRSVVACPLNDQVKGGREEKADDDERATRKLVRDGFYKNAKQSNEETVCR